jgi:sulfate adenylyltransferase
VTIPPPHGGRLVTRQLLGADLERRRAELHEFPVLRPSVDAVYNVEKIAIGAYSPLEGFMDSSETDAVLDRGRLTNDLPWPIPIVLAPSGRENLRVLESLRAGDTVAIADGKGSVFALLHVSERFPIDRGRFAQSAFGTRDPAHPNVADLMSEGEQAVAGSIDLLRRLELPTGPDERTPAEVRAEFQRRKWSNVAAYQCRNPPHTAHEYLQRMTLEREDIDGLFIHPVVGRLKKGDYRPSVILECYRMLVERYYPSDRVLLAALSVSMLYAGPKGALFFAIVRKNFGCSHYIVGRDQAGVGTYYDPYACHRIFDEFDIGIVPLRYLETFYCRRCGGMATPKTCLHPAEDRVDTSQTRIRRALAEHRAPPVEVLRPEIYQILSRGNVLQD